MLSRFTVCKTTLSRSSHFFAMLTESKCLNGEIRTELVIM